MPRPENGARTPFASPPPGDAGTSGPVRPPAARPAGSLVRILLAPLAALAAAVAGLVYVLLLPICGIASIASASAQASWGLVRRALAGARRRAAPRS